MNLERLLEVIDKKIKDHQAALHWAESNAHINYLVDTISFMQSLRGVLTLDEIESLYVNGKEIDLTKGNKHE